MSILDILNGYTHAGVPPATDIPDHFDAIARDADPAVVGSGVSAAIRSDATPSFGETIGKLFGHSDPAQKAGVINEIMQALGPAAMAGVGGGLLGKVLDNVSASPAASITPEQASRVSPDDMSTIAASAQQRDDGLVDRLGAFYAQHPTLVKTLGVAALGVAMTHMNSRQRV